MLCTIVTSMLITCTALLYVVCVCTLLALLDSHLYCQAKQSCMSCWSLIVPLFNRPK